MKHDMKAFTVLENDECTGAIIFAKHAIVARRLGANEYAGGEFGAVSCRRAPWADAYVERKLPARLMIAHGWHFECSQCDARITEDYLYDMNLPLEGVIGSQHTHVFCGTRCARKYYSIQRRRKAEEQRAIETFKEKVRQRFPEADFCDEPDAGSFRAAHHAYVVAGRAGWQWRQVSVAFRFDGMKIAPAHFSVMDGNNPPAAQYTCCPGDKEAFSAYVLTTAGHAALAQGGQNNG